MSLKRKCSGYFDPDYPQFNSQAGPSPVKNPKQRLPSAERDSKVRRIINREFDKALTSKEEEVLEIDRRILKAKRLLQRLRYAIVLSYYFKCEKISDDRNDAAAAGETSGFKQEPIHPAVKRLIGKGPVDLNSLIRPMRKATQSTSTVVVEKFSKQKLKDFSKAIDEPKLTKVPVPSGIDNQPTKINSSRGRSQTKHIIAVGNTSKFIGVEDSKDQVTHKWLVYVQSKSETPIQDIVQKVRFFLHPSYKPNDVVDVTSPPFILLRRGWGEFLMRVLLFFYPETNQKPIQIFHNLVLDKSKTGLQAMGAETTIEMWLSGEDDNTNEIKQENFGPFENHKQFIKVEKTGIKKPHLNSIRPNEIVRNGTVLEKKNHNTTQISLLKAKPLVSLLKSSYAIQDLPSKELSVSPTKTWKHLDHSYVKPINAQFIQIKLVEDETPAKSPNDSPAISKLEMEIQSLNFTNTRFAVEHLLRKIPLIASSSTEEFPFSVINVRSFLSLPSWRRQSLEWSRAKTVNRILKGNTNLMTWTTKEVLLFARQHGYSPCCLKSGPAENKIQSSFPSDETQDSIESISSWIESKLVQKNKPICDIEEKIDVEESTREEIRLIKNNDSSKLRNAGKGVDLEADFIRKACLDIGISLENSLSQPGNLKEL